MHQESVGHLLARIRLEGGKASGDPETKPSEVDEDNEVEE
jgi:hypothetical protein